jgi:hypothetical protein
MQVAIDRLTLDGFSLGVVEQRAVRRAFASELTRLLSEEPLPERLSSGGWTPRLPGRELSIGTWTSGRDLGHRIARAVFHGLKR